MEPTRKFCRTANINDLTEVAWLHKLAFPGFFLTSLGSDFLLVMYRSFLENKYGIFIVYENNQRLTGFAVGAMKSAGKDRKLAIRLFPQFSLAIIPAVTRNPILVLKRIFSQFFSIRDEPSVPEGAAILRSIGVLPDVRGQGIAEQLLIEFEQQAKNKGAKIVALTTDALDNERAIGFYRKHGYHISQEFKQDKNRQMFLMLKNINFQI